MKLFEKINAGEVYFIAEMSANHAGRLEYALDIVRAAKDAGADCIKVQTYTADTMTLDCDNDYFKISGGLWDGYTLHQLYSEAALPWEWHEAIKEEADELGIDFLSTPFDRSAVDFLESLGAEAYKIASFELTDIPLLQYVAAKGKPVILSTGMAALDEIETAVRTVQEGGGSVVLLKCTSEYPAVPEHMNLVTIGDMKKRFGVPVGLSDHSAGSVAAATATVLGARVIEKHFCLSREIENPDSEFSMEPHEFRKMAEDVRYTLSMYGDIQYGPTENERDNLKFRRSVFAVADIAAGEVFTEDNIRVIRPSDGLAPVCFEKILGTKSKRTVKRGNPVTKPDTEL